MQRRIAILAIASATFFTAAILVWRFGFDADPYANTWSFPPLPRMHGFEAFDLILWLVPIGDLAIVAILAALALRWVTRWRGATSWIPVFLPILVCLLTAAVFVPFWGAIARRVDRVARSVEEPIPALRNLTVTVVVTFILAATFIAVTRQKRTPAIARQAALVPAAVLCGVLLNLYFLFLVFPMTNDWWPARWDDSDLLVPMRPCRGALLWITVDGTSHSFGRIDGVWLRFADRRVPGELIRAISVRGDGRPSTSGSIRKKRRNCTCAVTIRSLCNANRTRASRPFSLLRGIASDSALNPRGYESGGVASALHILCA